MIKRHIYNQVVDSMNDGRIPIMIGMRRIGKTTLLEQLAKSLDNAKIITWDLFDFQRLTDQDFFNYLNELCKAGGILLFDEVQVRKNWDLIIKNLFDIYVKKGICKIVVTGSSSMILDGKDMGVTRTEKILIDTWNFDEYCELTKMPKTFENFEEFLGYGFPEFMDRKNDFEKMLHLTLKPILEDDLPKAYPGIDTLALNRFIYQLSRLTNGEVNETRLSIRVGISIPTVRKYIDILEKSLLIKKVYKMHIDGSMPKKHTYKIYINPHIQMWLMKKNFKSLENKTKGHIIESYWLHWAKGINGFNKTFYYIKDEKNNKEIDFASIDSDGNFKTLHEFKYKENISHSELLTLLTTNSKNKVVWTKQTKQDSPIKYISILDINNN